MRKQEDHEEIPDISHIELAASSLHDSSLTSAGTTTNGNLDRWETRWKENNLRWHKNEINPYLQKFINLFIDDSVKHDCRVTKGVVASTETNTIQKDSKEGEIKVEPFSYAGNENQITKRVFVPLCGKSMDIAYILSQGHEVFGVEGVLEAIKALDEENSFKLHFDAENAIFHTADRKLCIFHGDIFECPIEKWGPFDCVWDKASLTAIDLSLRSAYKDILQRSLKKPDGEYHNFCYLLQTVNYDKSKADGRGPKCVDENDMIELFGDWTEIRLLESVPLHENHVIRKIPDVGSRCNEEIFILHPKLKVSSK